MMDARVKEDWLEALRSGEYEQGQEYLNRAGRYCCLGVLAEISEGFTKIQQEGEDVPVSYRYGLVDENFSEVLPRVFQDHVGFSAGHASTLMRMNDRENKTFPEIADYIEVTL